MSQLRRGLYRDDALLLLENPTPRRINNYKKNIHKFIDSFGLKIVIDKEHSVLNYLDVTSNLFEGTYKPSHKLNENLKYISISNNHRASNKRDLIYNVSKRISITRIIWKFLSLLQQGIN